MNATRSHRITKLWYITVLTVILLTGLSVVGGMLGVLKVLLVLQRSNPPHEVAVAVRYSEPSR